MYLTAQLVRNAVRNWEGVNAFLYEEPNHLDVLPPGQPARALLREVERYARGKTLRGSIVNVPPGGNAVAAYLDVVIDGGVPPVDRIDAVEQRTRQELEMPSAAETVVWADRDLLVRAYVRPDLDPVETLARLMGVSRQLVADPHRQTPPITILERHSGERTDFVLDEQSTVRLRALHGEGWTVPRVGITDDVRVIFEATHGSIYSQIATVMTGGLETTHLNRIGGVEFVDASGAVTWPR